MKKNCILFLLLLFFGLAGQPPSSYFGKFGGPGDDIGYSAKQTFNGNYIVAGSSTSNGNGTELYLVKIDSMAAGLWEKYYGGNGSEVGKSVIQLPDSGYVVAGFTDSFGAGGYDAYLIRVDKNGSLIWQRTFGGTDWDFANDLVLAPDGNLFVVGSTYSFGNGKKDGFILKYDLQGSLITQKFFGGAENDELRSIIVTRDNYLATVGYTESRGEINGDGYFLKLDLNGDTLFTRTFGGPFRDYASDLVQKSTYQNNEIIISGAKTYSTLSSKTHAYAYRMSEAGNFLSDKDYFQNAGDEEFISVASSRHLSGLTAYLRTAFFPTFALNGEVILAYQNGQFYKSNHFGGSKDDIAYSVEATKDGGYLTVGSTLNFGSRGLDVFFMKHDSTCYYYTSVLGLQESNLNIRPFVYNLENKNIGVQFTAEELPRSIAVVDLNGKLVKEVRVSERRMVVDLSDMNASVYLIRFRYSGGRDLYQKLILTE